MVVLQGNNISKEYLRGSAKSGSLRETLVGMFRRSKKPSSIFKALDDVSFQVHQGDTLAIIGKNGAGKSTLLKVMSRITHPTHGRLEINGRVASLLEVGTGFHPELTGRENIFMNATILGMTRAETKKRFDEIVAFSEVEKFLDTPVKHYSSGMYVRLAFAVAAHLEPEILLIDEVLSVGDVDFQKKCIGKMESVSGEGRTVIFVSHNMEAVRRLCKRGIVLQAGKKTYDGSVEKAVDLYHGAAADLENAVSLEDRVDRGGSGAARYTRFWMTDQMGNHISRIQSGDQVNFHALINPKPDYEGSAYATLSLCDRNGLRLFSLASILQDKKFPIEGRTEIVWTIEKFPLCSDEYICDLYLFERRGGRDMLDKVEQAFRMQVDEGDFFETGVIQAKGRDRLFCDFDVIRRTSTVSL